MDHIWSSKQAVIPTAISDNVRYVSDVNFQSLLKEGLRKECFSRVLAQVSGSIFLLPLLSSK